MQCKPLKKHQLKNLQPLNLSQERRPLYDMNLKPFRKESGFFVCFFAKFQQKLKLPLEFGPLYDFLTKKCALILNLLDFRQF